jgi:hypothetical protein
MTDAVGSETVPATATVAMEVAEPSTGAVNEMVRGVVLEESVTVMVAVPTFPAASVACTVIVLAPATSAVLAEKELPGVTLWPFTVTDTMESAAVTVPEIVMGELGT